MNLVYALIVFSLLYVLQLYFNRNMFLKIITVTYLFLISSALYFSFETYKGWPTQHSIKKAYLVSVEIIQPSKDFPGAIYLWVYDQPEEKPNSIVNIFSYSDKNAPRAYYLPYTQSSNDKFNEAKKQIENGMVVELNGEAKQPVESEEQEGGDNGDGNRSDSDVDDYRVPSIKIISPSEILRKE